MDQDQALEALQDLRGRVLRKEEITPEEYSLVVGNLRTSRKAGDSTAAKNKKTKDEDVQKAADDLLSQLV